MFRASLCALLILIVPNSAPGAEETAADSAPLITPPRMLARTPDQQRAISNCYARSARRQGSVGRLVVEATIGIDGRLLGYHLAPGIPEWQAKTAACVMAIMQFEPGKRGGVAVEAEVKLPLNFSLDNSPAISLPQVATPAGEIEDIYRACYPPDQLAIANPQYRAAISATGKARWIELVESSGVESLDQAGACVLERLRFEPARSGKTAVETTAIVPILLRPPK